MPKPEIQPDEDFVLLVRASGSGVHPALDVSETPIQEHPRVDLDLYAEDAASGR